MFEYTARITAVYDGDTVTADIDLGFGVWKRKETLRLWGINAPEMRGSTLEKGRRSRDALRSKVLNLEVRIVTIKDSQDKYGRYLALIYVDTLNINQWMLAQGLAVDYMSDV